MKRMILMALGGGVLVALAGGFFYYAFYVNEPAPLDADSLAKKAMEAPVLEDRLTAASELSNLEGDEALIQLKRLAKESKDPRVIARVLPQLAARKRDSQTVELLLDTLSHGDAAVREVAFEELRSLVKIDPKDKASFVPDDPADKREPAAKLLKEKYQKAPLR